MTATAVVSMTERLTKSDFDTRAKSSPAVTSTTSEQRMSAFLPWAFKQIEPVTKFADNWDGYGAAAVTAEMASNAACILASLKAVFNVAEPIVGMTPDGGISFEWECQSRSLEIEIESELSLGTFLYRDTVINSARSGSIMTDNQVDPRFNLALRLMFL